jgi:hypothetical protein
MEQRQSPTDSGKDPRSMMVKETTRIILESRAAAVNIEILISDTAILGSAC